MNHEALVILTAIASWFSGFATAYMVFRPRRKRPLPREIF